MVNTCQRQLQRHTCDNSLSINLIEACDREADHAAIGILDIRLTGINLTAAVLVMRPGRANGLSKF